MCTDTGIQTYTIDYGLRIQPLHLGICIQFIEIRHTQCQISVGKELHRLCLLHAHEERVDVLFQCTLMQQPGKYTCKFFRFRISDSTNCRILFR